MPIKVGLALVTWFMLTMPYIYYTNYNRKKQYSIIILKHKVKSPSFWQRNKDQIWLLLLGGGVGSFLTILVQLIEKLF